jgi:hypothetical protein
MVGAPPRNKKGGIPGSGPVAVSFVNGRAIAVPVKRCPQWAALCPYALCPCPAGPTKPQDPLFPTAVRASTADSCATGDVARRGSSV